MDAQSRSAADLPEPSTRLLAFVTPAGLDPAENENDDGFPADLSRSTDCDLLQRCDELFVELDSEMPDLRAMERYQAICDELTRRQFDSGVA